MGTLIGIIVLVLLVGAQTAVRIFIGIIKILAIFWILGLIISIIIFGFKLWLILFVIGAIIAIADKKTTSP